MAEKLDKLPLSIRQYTDFRNEDPWCEPLIEDEKTVIGETFTDRQIEILWVLVRGKKITPRRFDIYTRQIYRYMEDPSYYYSLSCTDKKNVSVDPIAMSGRDPAARGRNMFSPDGWITEADLPEKTESLDS